jgi:effector-binding domain-containing protein
VESNVVIIEFPEQPALCMRFRTSMDRIGDDVGNAYGTIFTYLGKVGAEPAGPPLALYYDMEMKPDDIDMEVCVPVAAEMPGEGEVAGRMLEGGKFASIMYKGPYDQIGPAYDALFAYLTENALSMAGPSRELYLTDPAQVESPADNITQVVFPI